MTMPNSVHDFGVRSLQRAGMGANEQQLTKIVSISHQVFKKNSFDIMLILFVSMCGPWKSRIQINKMFSAGYSPYIHITLQAFCQFIPSYSQI